MFTQEQLGAIKGVVVEAVTPLLDTKLGALETRLTEKMDKSIDSHAEQIAKVSVQVTVLEKKMEEGFKDIQEDMGPLCKEIKDIKWDVRIANSKLSIAEENKPALFMRRR